MRSRSLLLPTLLATSLWSCQSADDAKAAPTDVAGWTFAVAPATTPFASPAQDIDLDAEADRLQRKRAKQQYLAEQYLARGDEAFSMADLDQALVEYANALSVMPTNQDARARMAKVESAMGNRYALAAEALEDFANREAVKGAQAMIAAEDAARKGDQALRRGEFDQAISQYKQADLILGYHPLVAEGNLTGEVIKSKLAQAEALRDEAQAQAAADRAARAEDAAAEAAVAERERKRELVYGLYSKAHMAFSQEDYEQAADLCEQVLTQDPGNPHAIDLRGLALTAGNKKATEENLDRLRNEWQLMMDDLNTMAVPQMQSVVFDDKEYWSQVVSTRKPIQLTSSQANLDSTRDDILALLDRTPIMPRFGDDEDGAPIEDVASFLQSLTGVNFIVHTAVLDDLDEDETNIRMSLPRMSVRKVLDLIADTSESLRWKVEDGVVKFVTVEQMTGGQVLELYAVSDIIRPVTDFPGRVVNVSPSGGLEQPEEDLEEREALVVTADDLDALIRDNVAPESWDNDEANSMRVTEHGVLVVNQTPDVHEKIQQLLEDLREATGIMVDIEARFMKVQDSFLEDIGVDFRGLGSPGLGSNESFNDFGSASAFADLGTEVGQDNDVGIYFDDGGDGDVKARIENLYDSSLGNDEFKADGGLSFQWTFLNDLQLEMVLRAVDKKERVEVVTAPHLLVANTSRSNLTITNQLAYVQDFNIEIAQGASIADPIIQTIQDGVVLDVRPVVSADRRFVTIEMRPTVAELKRPIKEINTGLASASSVTIQLPELEISRLRTTVPIPDGGTILLGGWKVHEEQNYSSGIPILNKIPVLNFLFERKGNSVMNRKLLILLKASIVMWQESEPTPAQLGQFNQ